MEGYWQVELQLSDGCSSASVEILASGTALLKGGRWRGRERIYSHNRLGTDNLIMHTYVYFEIYMYSCTYNIPHTL